jgi:predicted ester cyclase
MVLEPEFTPEEAKAFVRAHFEEFVNRKNIAIGETNFSPDFVDHGSDVPSGLPPGPAGAMQYVAKALSRIPDLHVTIQDILAEGDKVVVRNVWTGTDSVKNHKIVFGGIVIWRIAHRQLVERWAYLEPPRDV